MFGQGFNYGFLGKPLCFTDTTDIFKDNSGVALYTLDYDASDSGNATGKFGEAAIFNGSSSKITTSLAVNNIESLSVWFYFEAGTTIGRVLGTTVGSSGGNLYLEVQTTGSFSVNLQNLQEAAPSGALGSTGWKHIYYDTNRNLYLNGVSVSSTSSTPSFPASNVLIGALRTNYGFFNSKIDQIRFFNKVLSSSEISTLYNETKNTTNTLQILGDTSCIATYTFDGSSTDLSGNYNGTDTNIIYKYDGAPTNVDFGVGGKSLYGARFNGSSSKITTSLDFDTLTDYTVSMWIYIDATPSATDFFAGTVSGSSAFNGFYLGNEPDNEIRFYERNASTTITVLRSTDTINVGSWNHIVAVRDGNTNYLYINNGTPVSISNGSISHNENFTLGKAGSYGSGLFDGSIDQVRIFSKALSSSEVSKLYGNGAGEIACKYTSTTDDIAFPIANTAYYKLNNNSKDSAKSRGKFNQGATFVGNSAGIVNTTLQLSSTAHSVSLWMKPQDLTATKWQIMFFSAFNGYPSFTLGKRPDQTTSFHYRNESSNEVYFTLSNANTWYHVVVTRNNSGSTVYVNGSSVATDSNSMGTYPSSAYQKASIGSNPNYPAEYFDGTLDQIRVYDVALTSTDVANLYNSETTSTTNTLAFPTGKTAIATYTLDGNGVDVSGNYSGSEGDNIVYAYDGTDTNIEYRFGRFGQAAVFNGSSGFIDTNYTLTSDTSVSFSFWINVNDYASNDHYIFSDLSSSATDRRLGIRITSSGYFAIDVSSNGTNIDSSIYSSVISKNQWLHYVVVLDGTSYELYQDGILVHTDTLTQTLAAGGRSLIMGRAGDYNPATNFYYDGKIDQVRFFSTALTSAQISQLYNEKPETDTSNFKTVLWNGNGNDNRYISNLGIDLETSGGLVWTKTRTAAYYHQLQDSVREAGANAIYSNSTDAENGGSSTYNNTYGYINSFETNGWFTKNGSDGLGTWVNRSGQDYVAWVWKGGGDAVSNTDGTITSQVSANTEAGFSIVKYSGNTGADQTVGHGLSSTPEMVIVKRLTDAGYSWCVQHIGLTSMGYNIYLDGSGGELLRNRIIAWDSTTFTVEQVHEVNNTGKDYIAYCFHSVSGYSKIGSYEGSGSSQSIYVTDDDTSTGSGGFQPSFVMIKNIDAAANWMMYDAVRDSDGTLNLFLEANTSDSEASAATATISPISNGFTIGNSNSIHINDSTDTYIYMAFK